MQQGDNMKDPAKLPDEQKLNLENVDLSQSDEAIGRVMIAYTVLEKLLIAKGIITEKEIETGTEQVVKHFAEVARKLIKDNE